MDLGEVLSVTGKKVAFMSVHAHESFCPFVLTQVVLWTFVITNSLLKEIPHDKTQVGSKSFAYAPGYQRLPASLLAAVFVIPK